MIDKKIQLNIRNEIVGINCKVPLSNGKYVTAINFDNAATTPPFKTVINDINRFAPWYSSIHRGTGYKSKYSSRMYEESRETIMEFINANLNSDTIIFVKNTTEAINKLAHRLLPEKNKNVVLSTLMEHHSNDLPWRKRFNIDYIEVDSKGRLSIADLKNKLNKYKNSVRLVTVTGASNVTGYINPIHEIAKLAHKYGAEILVDAAQLISHAPIDMKPKNSPEHIDYLAFSAHKMYAPFGIGVLIGPKSTFEKGEPEYSGGGTIDIVTHDYIKWAKSPHKDEAGSPNIIGVIALISAINTLSLIGMENIFEHEKKLLNYVIKRLKEVPDIILYGDTNNYKDRLGIITFNIKGIHHEILANILSYEGGIAVRNGCFCAHPYIHRLLNINKKIIDERIKNPDMPHPGMVRISFGLYNNFAEIDNLINLLKIISNNKKYFIEKYNSKYFLM
ncbi:aminotransferase class V-fold PLP-dependent enzyme [Caminicella sporogenes]|nr:aminotransferase class V-fold PLP-dependent enzyme [Caminicella sporogenes]RKD25285.1 class V aminotransferase [Caminicella sporogenes]